MPGFKLNNVSKEAPGVATYLKVINDWGSIIAPNSYSKVTCLCPQQICDSDICIKVTQVSTPPANIATDTREPQWQLLGLVFRQGPPFTNMV